MAIRNQHNLEIAKRILAAYPKRKLKAETQRKYMATGRQFFHDHEAVLNTRSKRTFYLRKAALNFYAINMLDLAIKTGDEKLFDDSLATLKKFFTEDAPGDAMARGGKCPIVNPAPTRGKRKSLAFIPSDWMEIMLEGVTGQHRQWLLLLSAAGVRPQEIENGITVTPHKTGVILTIHSAKSSGSYGQPLRVFYVESVFAHELAQGGEQFISAKTANSVSSYVSKLGRKVFGDREDSVSAYSYRSQFAANLKASDLSSDDVSAILGHSVDDTKKLYGIRSQSNGAVKATLIFATREVKRAIKSTPLRMSKLTH